MTKQWRKTKKKKKKRKVDETSANTHDDTHELFFYVHIRCITVKCMLCRDRPFREQIRTCSLLI